MEARVLDAARSGKSFAGLCELIDRETADNSAAAQAASLLQRWIADERIAGIETRTSF